MTTPARSVIGQQFLIEPHGDVQRETNLVVVILLWWRGHD